MSPRIFPVAALFIIHGSAFAAATADLPKEQLDFFEKKVRPILVENCYKCHSTEKGKAKGDLTLDTRDAVLKGGKNGAAVVPGDPAKSLLVTAINYEDADLQMPPKGEKLTAAQIADLTEWVKMGAPDPRLDAKKIGSGKLSGLTDKARQHWAYQPVKKPAIPLTKNPQWCRTPVDAFILQKLDAKNMVPSPDADKEALLRRATYDLLGLPPTPQEVNAFLADKSPNAFAKVVDRLLASPHYGERWGRFWLDTARYADTAGGQKNAIKDGEYRFPYAWTYRDYVIKAFNDDKPYDKFIVEQLAADKLPDIAKDKTRLAALGFITVGERFKNPNDIINDRIDVVTKGFLGMTVTCARCHDHMFDPIPTKDYYALHGIFNSTLEPKDKPLLNDTTAAQQADFQQKLAALEQENRDGYYKFIERTLGSVQNRMSGFLQVGQYGGKKQNDAEMIKARNELMAKLKFDKQDRQLIQMVTRGSREHESVFGPFRMFMNLDDSDFSEKAPALAARIAANSEMKRHINPIVAAAFKDASISSITDVADIYGRLFTSLAPKRAAYIKACSEATSGPVTGFDRDLVEIIESPLDILPASELDSTAIREFAKKLPNQIGYGATFSSAKINELELTHPGAPARAMLVADAPRVKDSNVFIRGQADVRGDLVPRHFLEILSGGKPEPFKDGSGRLELANAIASKSNPLTARVIVNRVWMHHFGEGFVSTPDDLGTQSEPPSHPELLDYLSSYFMDNGWSFKKLHKLIMLSRVYQESTRTLPEYETIDPNNRMLWRANIRRLDFESTRDSLLVFSGKLDGTIGGKPINLTEEPYSYRRSVYGYIDRGNLPDIMSNFDFSDPDMPNSKRASTIVPQQALFLMNSAMSVDVARNVITRDEVANAPNNLSRVFAIYRVIFQRTPKPEEIQLALQFVGSEVKSQPGIQEESESPAAQKTANRQKARVANAKKQGRQSATRPIQNEGDMVERKPLTPWETYAQALLLSNESAYVN